MSSGTMDHRYDGYDSDTDGDLGFLAAPFSAKTWRATLHMLLNLPVGILGFSFVVTLFAFGLGTALTFIGLPLLAAMLASSRGLGAMERARAGALLGEHVPAPKPMSPTRPGLMGWIAAVLKDGGGWRAALYNVLMLPFGILSFTLVTVFWSVALECASYPLWQWVFPHFVGQPGIQLYENNGTSHYLSSVPEIAGTCALGLLLLFATPAIVRGLAATQRAMVRGLLGG